MRGLLDALLFTVVFAVLALVLVAITLEENVNATNPLNTVAILAFFLSPIVGTIIAIWRSKSRKVRAADDPSEEHAKPKQIVSKFDKKFKKRAKPSLNKKRNQRSQTNYSVVSSLKSFTTDVVGESNFQENLIEIMGPYTRDGRTQEIQCVIEREPENKFDKNAILVKIEGLATGYLPRDTAERVAAQMDNNSVESAICEARISGGWRTNQHDFGMYGVKLKIPKRGQIEFKSS
ncbi:HIRAN domain-containing protein [Tateyamaria sp.]|uniref:HIRAN domain-containing protein n=1 Tax=Tateyamaria sp. TaxID=1929288 RepID=UPI00329ECD79